MMNDEFSTTKRLITLIQVITVWYWYWLLVEVDGNKVADNIQAEFGQP